MRVLYETYKGINIYKESGWYYIIDEDAGYSRHEYYILNARGAVESYIERKSRMIKEELKMNNKELFDTVLGLSGGDDYDGCFTPEGEMEYIYYKTKLEERLKDFLEK